MSHFSAAAELMPPFRQMPFSFHADYFTPITPIATFHYHFHCYAIASIDFRFLTDILLPILRFSLMLLYLFSIIIDAADFAHLLARRCRDAPLADAGATP
jgi:hypothetical protein